MSIHRTQLSVILIQALFSVQTLQSLIKAAMSDQQHLTKPQRPPGKGLPFSKFFVDLHSGEKFLKCYKPGVALRDANPINHVLKPALLHMPRIGGGRRKRETKKLPQAPAAFSWPGLS